MNRIHPDAPVTFRDLIGPITSNYHVKNMTVEEFEATPFTTHVKWDAPQGWEKTGYRSPESFLVGHDNIVYWVFHEFEKYVPYEDDSSGIVMQVQRPKTTTYIIHVEGQPVFQRVNAYAKEPAEYVA